MCHPGPAPPPLLTSLLFCSRDRLASTLLPQVTPARRTPPGAARCDRCAGVEVAQRRPCGRPAVGSAGRVPRTGRGFGARLCRGRLLASSTSACPPQQRWPCSLGLPPFFSLALKEHVENSPSSTCFSMNLQVPPKVKFSGSLKAFFISPHFQKDFRWLPLHRNKRNIKDAGRPVRTGR